jgi:hypothetical protein
MRKILLLINAFIFISTMALGQTTIKYQSFESGSDDWNYTSDPSNFNTGSDVWGVVTSSFHTFSTIPSDATHFWGIEDLNCPDGTSDWGTLTFASVDISSYIEVTVNFDYEVDGYDWNDDIKYELFYDGTGQGEVTLVNGIFNTNQDGTVSVNVPDTINSVYIIVSVKQNGNDYGGFDNFKVTGTPAEYPTNFTATPHSTSQIDLSWTQNSDNDDVMVAWSSDGTFGTPSDGTTYSSGDAISGGGTVIYNGSATSYNHTGLTSGTHYYYKAWSVDGSVNYSSGVTDDATTYKNEPSNHVTDFTVSAASFTTIDLSWTENDGMVVPDGYLIIANTGTITNPSDGTDPTDDTDLTDGVGNVKVAHGTTSYSFSNCSESTTYNFKIYPYTNSGTAIDYKTDGTVPSASGATYAEPSTGDLFINEVNSTSNANASYVEIYNASSNEISLDKVDLVFYNNGGFFPRTTINLSGIISAGSYIVVARDNSTFNSTYGFNADFEDRKLYLNGGKDGLILKHDDNGDLDYFNDAPSPSVSWTDNHLFYRFKYTSDGSDLENDWDDSGLNKNGTPKAENKLTWKTTGTTDWSTGSNWDNGDVPSKGVDVVIPSGGTQPSADGTVANPAECMDLTINSGASLTIPVSEYMTVYGYLTNNAGSSGLIIQSGSTGDGSLIFATGSPAATVQRYCSSGGWHLVTPVTDYSISNDFYIDENNSAWLTYHTESTNDWTYITGLSEVLSRGTGYSYWGETDNTVEFMGNLTSSDFSSSLAYSGNGADEGWNLLGNPFSSAIDRDEGTWGSNTTGAVYVWDNDYDSDGEYLTYTPGSGGNLTNGVIPMGQGFFVKANAAGSFTIPQESRVHYATSFYKNENKENKHFVNLTLTTQGYKSEVFIGFTEDATEQFDNGYDADKLFSSNSSPQLFVVENNRELVINASEPLNNNDERIIPLNIRNFIDGTYQLVLNGLENLDEVSIYLEDLQQGIIHDFSNDPVYKFTASEGDNENRFILNFVYNPTGIENNQIESNSSITLYSHDESVYILSDKILSDKNGEIYVYDLLGKLIYKDNIPAKSLVRLKLNLDNQYVIVKVIKNNQIKTEKLFIK